MQFSSTLLSIALALTNLARAGNVTSITASKEAVLVQTSYAGCCGKPGYKCKECHIDVQDSLKVGNVHYRGNALLSFDLKDMAPKSCVLKLPAIQHLGGAKLNIQRSLKSDFNETSVNWNTAPEMGEKVTSFDVTQGSVDLSELCKESEGQMLTFFVTPGSPQCSIDLPSSNSNSPLELEIVS